MTEINEEQLLDIFRNLSEEDRNQLFLSASALTPKGKSEALEVTKRIKDISARVNALIKLIENKSSKLYTLLDSCISEKREEDKYLGVYIFSSNNPDIPITIIRVPQISFPLNSISFSVCLIFSFRKFESKSEKIKKKT